MKKITRRFFETTILPVAVVMRDGELEKENLNAIVVDGKIDLEKAEKIARKANQGKTVVIEDIYYTDELRGMTTETFIKYSEVITEKDKEGEE